MAPGPARAGAGAAGRSGRRVRAALACAAALAAVAAAAPRVAAAREVPVGMVEVPPRTYTVGSRIPVKLSVEVDEGSKVDWSRLAWNPGPVELRSAEPPRRERLPHGRARETVAATLASFELGGLVLRGPQVHVSGPDSGLLQLPSAVVVVRSVLAPSDKGRDIRDIKTAVPWRRPLPKWAWVALIALVALAVVALAAWLVRLWLRRRREAEARLPAHVRALRDLALLRATDWLRTGRVKDYHVRLTEVLRRYVGERCGFAALDLTTGELLDRLETALPDEHGVLRRVLETADLVKFARVTPAVGVPEELLDAAVGVVERTRPREAGEVAA
jgi:hypothetical protein